MNDILIRSGLIVDGTGTKPYMGDVLLRGGRIAAAGRIDGSIPAKIIDAGGLVVAPGFVDGHTHNEFALLTDPTHLNALTQGVTTEVIGQCGLGFAPASAGNRKEFIKLYAGIFGRHEHILPEWETFGQFISLYEKTGINVASAVGHAPIRACSAGFFDTKLVGDSLQMAKEALHQAMGEGAVGMSTGLSYYPAAYGDTQELIELCRVVAEYDGLFLLHTRAVERGGFDPIAEAIEIARHSGVKLHVLHYKTSWPASVGHPEKIVASIESAMRQGMDISAELYPYFAGCGFGIVFLPGWALEGGYENAMWHLSNAASRDALMGAMRFRYNKITTPPLKSVFTHLKKNTEYVGMDFDTVARLRGQCHIEMLIDLLHGNDLEVGFRGVEPTEGDTLRQLEEDMFCLLSRPYYMVGSDAIPLGLLPHPRLYGTFPRLLRMAKARDIPIEDMIYRITSLPAQRYGLQGRGIIKQGMAADICIFDSDGITDRATYEKPKSFSEGMRYVVVNGCIAIENGKATGTLAGKALRGRGK